MLHELASSSNEVTANRFTFDRTINLGHVLTIITMLVGMIAVIHKIDEVQYKVDMMWNQFAKEHNICCSVLYRIDHSGNERSK